MANFEEIYNQIYNSLPDVEAKLKEMQQSDTDALTTQRDAQDKRLQEERDETLRQAYITQEMNKRDVPAMMSAQGLTGGITETVANDLLRDYRNSTNAARKGYTNAYTDLSTTYDTNVASLNSTYAQKIMDSLAQKRAEALQRSQIAYQIRQAEEAAAASAWAAQQQGVQAAALAGNTGGTILATEEKTPIQKSPYNSQTTNNYAWQNASNYPKNTVNWVGARSAGVPATAGARTNVWK